MGNNTIEYMSKVAEMINEETYKEFFEIIESIHIDNDETKNLEVLLARKGDQLGLSDEWLDGITFYLLGKLHGGNNVKT